MTAHWLSNEFSQQRAVLRVMHFPESHTGKNISEHLHKALLSFEIPYIKIHIVLRGNAANMVAGVRDSGFKSMPCFIHTIELCIHQGCGVGKPQFRLRLLNFIMDRLPTLTPS